eukprot:PhM_4_TR14001/c0_g1_i1/m.86723
MGTGHNAVPQMIPVRRSSTHGRDSSNSNEATSSPRGGLLAQYTIGTAATPSATSTPQPTSQRNVTPQTVVRAQTVRIARDHFVDEEFCEGQPWSDVDDAQIDMVDEQSDVRIRLAGTDLLTLVEASETITPLPVRRFDDLGYPVRPPAATPRTADATTATTTSRRLNLKEDYTDVTPEVAVASSSSSSPQNAGSDESIGSPPDVVRLPRIHRDAMTQSDYSLMQKYLMDAKTQTNAATARVIPVEALVMTDGDRRQIVSSIIKYVPQPSRPRSSALPRFPVLTNTTSTQAWVETRSTGIASTSDDRMTQTVGIQWEPQHGEQNGSVSSPRFGEFVPIEDGSDMFSPARSPTPQRRKSNISEAQYDSMQVESDGAFSSHSGASSARAFHSVQNVTTETQTDGLADGGNALRQRSPPCEELEFTAGDWAENGSDNAEPAKRGTPCPSPTFAEATTQVEDRSPIPVGSSAVEISERGVQSEPIDRHDQPQQEQLSSSMCTEMQTDPAMQHYECALSNRRGIVCLPDNFGEEQNRWLEDEMKQYLSSL